MSENYGGRRPEDEGNQPENGVDQDQNQWRPGAGSANEAPQQQWGEPQQQWNNQDSQPQGVGSANEAPQQWGNQEPQQFQATSAPEAGQYGQGFDPNANQQFQASSAPEAGQYGQGVGSANGAPQQWGSQEPQQFQASSAPEAGQYGQDYGQVPYGASAQQTGQYNPNQNQQGQNFGGGQYNQGQQGVNPSGQPGYGGQFGGQYGGGFGQPPYGGNGGYGQPPQSNKGKMVGWKPALAEAPDEVGGWEWLYTLEPNDAHSTTVTLTYNWNDVTDKDLLAQLPLVSEEELEQSLNLLASALA